MTNKRIFAVMLAAAISTALFAGCSAFKNNEAAKAEPGVASDASSQASHIEDKIEEVIPGGNDAGSTADNPGKIVDEDDGTYTDETESDAVSDKGNSSKESSVIDSAVPDSSAAQNSTERDDLSVAAAMSADFSEIGALSGAKDTGFPGGPVDNQNRPSGPVSYQQKYGKYGAYFIVPDSKKIYLTFDEGYENGYTSRILDILREKNVKAVFFITYPYAQTETALVRRMIAEGHTLGNHSTKHPIFPDLPLQEAAKDLSTLHEYVLANYGYRMSLFRPPEGAFSEQTLALAQKLGYNTMLWSFAYKDYDVNNQPINLEATENIVKRAHPGEICLLHAVSRTNAEILGDVIDQLRAKGFTFADYFYFQ